MTRLSWFAVYPRFKLFESAHLRRGFKNLPTEQPFKELVMPESPVPGSLDWCDDEY
jgi:hypothetical protein